MASELIKRFYDQTVLKQLRVNAGYSQEELADMIYVSKPTICRWEKGYGVPNAINLVRLCDIFNVPFEINISCDMSNQCFVLNFTHCEDKQYCSPKQYGGLFIWNEYNANVEEYKKMFVPFDAAFDNSKGADLVKAIVKELVASFRICWKNIGDNTLLNMEGLK